MFGYVLANRKALSVSDKKKYKSFYCGLCRQLKHDYGKVGMMVLSYDMTFLKLLLSDLYDEELKGKCERCVIHPIVPHECILTHSDKYTADMTMLLTYYSLLDHQKDNDRGKHKNIFKKIEVFIPSLTQKYPRQAKAMKENLEALELAEKNNEQNPEKLSSYFGALLGQVFTPYDDNWATELYAIGEGLGRFIYLLDAYLDLKKDLKRGAFNPFKTMKDEPNFNEKVTDLLSWAAADAAKAYEYLPVDEHNTLLQNILYSGIWSLVEGNKTK